MTEFSKATSDTKDWVILKRGYYYRPNRAGYTKYLEEAGRYTEEEAKAEAAIEPCCMSALSVADALSAAEHVAPDPRQEAFEAMEAALRTLGDVYASRSAGLGKLSDAWNAAKAALSLAEKAKETSDDHG